MCSWKDHEGLGDESGGAAALVGAGQGVEVRALVYRMFGRLDDVSSLVLTEDDYFEYLIRITRQTTLARTGGSAGRAVQVQSDVPRFPRG